VGTWIRCSILEDDVESVDDTGEVTKDGQKDVDPKVTVISRTQFAKR